MRLARLLAIALCCARFAGASPPNSPPGDDDEIKKNNMGMAFEDLQEVEIDASTRLTDDLSVALAEIAVDSGVDDEKAVLVAAPDPAKHRDGDSVGSSETLCSFEGMEDKMRGATLKPGGEPMLVGQFLSSEGVHGPSTLSLTADGDLLLTPGCMPDSRVPAYWAYRARAPGLKCTIEMMWRNLLGKEAIPISLTVRNGRWRVGRGFLCTLSKSRRLEGGWKAFVPYDAHGLELRKRYLLADGHRFVLKSEDIVVWDSSVW